MEVSPIWSVEAGDMPLEGRHAVPAHGRFTPCTYPAFMDTPTALLNRDTILGKVICSIAETCCTWASLEWPGNRIIHACSSQENVPFCSLGATSDALAEKVSRADG